MQYITTLYVPLHTGLGIINSTTLLSESQKRVGWGRRQYKVGVNRPICLYVLVGVKTRKYGSHI